MKKKFLLALMLITLTIVAFGTISASAETEGIYTYTVTNGEVTITSCSWNASGEIIIPDTIGGYPVVSISDWAFSNCENITSINIGNNVTTIGKNTFSHCKGLESVTIPEGVVKIGASAFSGCSFLQNIYWNAKEVEDFTADDCVFSSVGQSGTGISVLFGDSVEKIPSYAFWPFGGNSSYAPKITGITMGKGVTSIGKSAFYYCTGITSINIPETVTAIGDYAFYGCSNLTSATIPNGVTKIGKGLFSNCTNIINITIPNSVNTIEEYAFYFCGSLTSITIPDGVNTIGKYTFAYCDSLTNVTIPNSVTAINEYAFYYCNKLEAVFLTDLKSYMNIDFANEDSLPRCNNVYLNNELVTALVIPEGVKKIQANLFKNNTNISSLVIPESVISIGKYAFDGCTSLQEIYWNAKSVQDFTRDHYAFRSVGSNTDGVKLYFGDTVERLPKFAFKNTLNNSSDVPNITEITLGKNITEISDYAFMDLLYLEKIYWNAVNVNDFAQENYVFYCIGENSSGAQVVFGDTVENIPAHAFESRSSEKLTAVKFGGSIKNIGEYAFYGCDITEIVIPDGLSRIGKSAFRNCRLKDVTFEGNIGIIEEDAFANNYNIENFYVSDIKSYLSTEYKNTYSIPRNYSTGTIKNLYINNTIPTEIVIPEGITTVPDYAFRSRNCIITQITLPSSIKKMGKYPFNDNLNLEKLCISDVDAYLNCEYYDNYVPFRASKVYVNDKRITSLNISNDVTNIPGYAFYNWDSLTGKVKIPDSVKSIGEYAFYSCEGLENVEIGNGVTIIDDKAFQYCKNLTSVVVGNNVKSIEHRTFDGCSNLLNINLPNGLDTIGAEAFSSCKLLKNIIIPESVISIGSQAFYSSGLESIIIPETVIEIEGPLFQQCYSLNSVVIKSNITIVNRYMFSYCQNLSELSLPDTVETIDEYAFEHCGLSEIVIPRSVSEIEQGAFESCSKLSTVYYNGNQEEWDEIYIGSNNDHLKNATKKFFLYVTLLDENGNQLSKKMYDASALINISDEEKIEHTIHLYTDEECINEYYLTTPISENLTLYLRYVPNQYLSKFVDYDGNIIWEGLIDYGAVITPPESPERERTQQYTYAFAGWDGFEEGITQTNQEMVFTAMYDATVNRYTYKFLDENGVVIKEETVDYGTTIELPAYTPKANTKQYTYTFLGWDGYTDGMMLTDDVTFDTKYQTTINQYTYKFIDENEVVIKEETVDYGTTIELPEYSPMANTQQYTYTFLGWDGYTDGMVLTDDITFNVKYEITTNQYTYKFLDEDGSVLKEEKVDYGTPIIAPEISDKTEYYLFDYWKGYTDGITLTDDITFTAVYKYKDYTITAEGLADAITVTYNSDFVIQPQTPAEEYLFIGYFTEKDGAGVQITNENGESITVYNTVGDLVIYPYFESVYMNKIVLSETTPTILGGEFTQKLTFATKHNAMYLITTLKYPEYLNFEEISGIDFVEASKDAEKTVDGYKYLDITAIYNYDGENVSKNTKIVPFEVEFSVPLNALVGDAKIEIDSAVLVGDRDYAFETVVNNNAVILPKLAESIEIIGKDEIDATEQFSAVVSPDYTTNKSVVWSVNDESIATISQDGTVTPVKNGTVIITATAKDGSEVFATKSVNVIAYAKINSLDFGSGVVLTEFNPNIRKYTVYVKENATSISLTPTFSGGGVLRPNGSGVWVSGRSKDFELNDVVTTITFNRENVTDMTNSIYTVEVVKFERTKTEVSEDKKSFTITPINIENGKTVILALYNGEQFVEMQSATYEGESITFTTTKSYTNAKVMVWDVITNLKPVCGVEEIN